MHALSLVAFFDETGVEDRFWGHESWSVDGDGLAVWKLVHLLVLGALCSPLFVNFWVEGDEAEIFFDLPHKLHPSRLAADLHDSLTSEQVDKMLSNGSPSNKVLLNSMRDGEALEDRDSVGNSVARVAHQSGGPSIGVERQHSLDIYKQAIDLEGLEHEFCHLLSVRLRVEWGLS